MLFRTNERAARTCFRILFRSVALPLSLSVSLSLFLSFLSFPFQPYLLFFFYIAPCSRRPFYRWLSHISSLSRTTDCAAHYIIELLRLSCAYIGNTSLSPPLSLPHVRTRWNFKTFLQTATFVQSFAFNTVCTLSFNFARWDYFAASVVTAYTFYPAPFSISPSLILSLLALFSLLPLSFSRFLSLSLSRSRRHQKNVRLIVACVRARMIATKVYVIM